MKDKRSSQRRPQISAAHQDVVSSQNMKEKKVENCIVKVVFKNENFFRKYKPKLEEFLNELLEEDFIIEHEFECEKQDLSFHIDKEHDSTIETITNEAVPFYSNIFEDILHNPEPVVEEKVVDDKAPGMTCFNCLGDHHMKDCPENIDWQRINANKKKLMAMTTSNRYHDEEKKNAIKPGCPSEELRKALYLEKHQLPLYIYNMRIIGYPPGWMQEAEHETSGLALYDESGVSTENCADKLNNCKPRYDSEKFINYPGFNSPVPKGFKDEWQKLGMLPIQQHQQLSEVLNSKDESNSRNGSFNNGTQENDNLNNCTVTQSNKSSFKKKLSLPPPTNDDNKNMTKRKLCLPPPVNDDNKKSKSGTNETNADLSPNTNSTPERTKSGIDLNLSLCESPIVDKNKSRLSLSKSPGTPVVDHGNPFLRLPSANKFAQDITEHLPFENLPDAVGKFENMRHILSNVQKKLKVLKES